MDSLRQPLVGNFGLWLVLLQLKPGTETIVNDRLTQSLPNARPYKCFGKFDYMLMTEFQDFAQLRDLDKDLLDLSSNILQVNHIVCYALDNPCSCRLSADAYAEEPFATITFLKFQHGLMRQSGVSLISAFNSYLGEVKAGLRSSHQILYGCLGWNELLLVTLGKDLDNTLCDIAAIGKMRTKDLGLPGEYGLFADTFSIAAMRFGCVQELLSGGNLADSGVPEVQKIQVSLSVSCSTGRSRQRILDKIDEYFGDCKLSLLYGKDDILVQPNTTLTTAFLTALLRFREDAEVRQQVFGTCTTLALPWLGEEKDSSSPPAELVPQQEEKVEVCSGITELRDQNYPLFKSLNDILCSMNAYFSDPVLCDAFLDMVPFLKRLALAPKEEVYDLTMDLWQAVNVFSKGFKQRFVGSSVTLFNVTESILSYQGGLQRVNVAACLIPAVLLKRLKHEWYGYTVFGVGNQYKRYHFGVINLPYECLFEPARWFGVFHEVGHDLAHKRQVLQADPSVLKEAGIADLGDYAKNNTDELDDKLPDLITAVEAYSDLFDFLCGFREDWSLYASKVLRYVFSNVPQELRFYRAYFKRTFMVFCYHKLGIRQAFEDLASEDFEGTRRRLLEELYDELCGLVESVKDSMPLNFDLIRDVYVHHARWRKFCKWAASDIETLREPIPEKWNDRCIEAVQDLRKGIARDDFDDADGLILSLPMEERDVRLVIAIILSLSTRYLSQFAPSSLPVFVRQSG
ncbi:MAG: hypothetical protein A2Y72_04140 [Chloroflexi bacterium RBG_13_53_26]|nr:MAG: hypothetical protein A2Y72_04140 [Chloroflexi bacterium RBG_13_53_26]